MFTGIVEERGRVTSVNMNGDTARISVHAPTFAGEGSTGDSISVNGVCLTAVALDRETFSADISAETLRRTTLGRLRSGSAVNLERPVRMNGRLGGHLVQGHVDGVAEFIDARSEGDSYILRFRPPEALMRYIVGKGSIALDGISLTISALTVDTFEVAIIPHTWKQTNLSALSPGDGVNLEVDIVAKYVERLLGPYDVPAQTSRLTLEYLKEQGY